MEGRTGGNVARGEVERLAEVKDGGEEEEEDLISLVEEEGERARGEMSEEDRGGEPIARRGEVDSEIAPALAFDFSGGEEGEDEDTWKSTLRTGTEVALVRAW